jgi:hypothetical protein
LTPAAAAAAARSSLVKVSRFKSSPLGFGENTGAEKVNEGDRAAGAGGREFEVKEDKGAKEDGRMGG